MSTVRKHTRTINGKKVAVTKHKRKTPVSSGLKVNAKNYKPRSMAKKSGVEEVEFDAQGLTGWKKIAKREFEEQEGIKTDVSSYGYYEEEGALALEAIDGETSSSGESEWIIFENMDKAERVAVKKVEEDLDDNPDMFSQDWLQNYITMSDTDRRITADEMTSSYLDDIRDEDDGERIIDEADMKQELDDLQEALDDEKITESEFDTGKEKLVDKAYDDLTDSMYDEIYKSLEDPINYFVEEQGIYSIEDLMKSSFIMIDTDKASQDAVDTDGVAHFLDGYDGEEIDLPSGAVAFGTN